MTEVERRHIEALAAISDEGTITAAAGKLHVSQPTLSRTLSRLETIVGVRLVDRSTHHLALTAAGQRFLPHARSALAAIETAVASALATAGAIRIGYAWATNDHVAALVKLWETTNPDLAVTPVYDEQPLTALANGAIDLAIIRSGPVANTLTVTLATENR